MKNKKCILFNSQLKAGEVPYKCLGGGEFHGHFSLEQLYF